MGKRNTNMGKRARGVSIIGGADGPTSIFLVGGKKKRTPKERVRGFIHERKRNRIQKKITANPHTPEELAAFLKREYGARELSKKSRTYQEQRRCMKESLVTRYRPELLGDLAEIRFPKEQISEKTDFSDRESRKVMEEFWKKCELRSQRAEEIPEDVFPMDFHIYEIRDSEGSRLQTGIETIWGQMGVSWSGNPKKKRAMSRISKRIYLYYGVSEEDIKKGTERYTSLVTALSVD